MNELTISNEDQAWEVFEKAISGSFDGDVASVKFLDWPQITITLDGGKFESSLTTAVMENLIEVQKNLNRSYALLNYNINDSRKNTAGDRDNIELVFKVEKGSTDITAGIANGLQNLITSMGDKMSPTEFLVLILGGGLLYCAQSVYRARLQKQIDEKKIDADLEVRKEDTERFKMLADVVAKAPVLKAIAYESEDAQAALVKAASYADKASLMGIDTISKSAYQSLTKNPRSKSKEVRLDGSYRVLIADKGNSEGRFKLSGNHGEFTASMDEENLDSSEIDIFKSAFWSGAEIELKINAKSLRGNIFDASIVGVKNIDDDA